jgi:putative transposase
VVTDHLALIDHLEERIHALFKSISLDEQEEHAVKIEYIQPSKPAQNGFVERFNRTYREEVLDAYLFSSLEEAKRITADWLHGYNSIRPHASLGNQTPYEYSTETDGVYL